MKVTLIGIGMEGKQTLTREAADAIGRSDLLIGAKRMLEPFASSEKRRICCHDFRRISEILLEEARGGSVMEAAVLLSGDTGFFSGARSLLSCLEGSRFSAEGLSAHGKMSLVRPSAERPDIAFIQESSSGSLNAHEKMPLVRPSAEKPDDAFVQWSSSASLSAHGEMSLVRLPEDAPAVEDSRGNACGNIQIEILPGVSSLSYLCARTGLSYENMKIVSLHGRDGNIAVHVLQNERTFFLLGGKTDAAGVCRTLCRYGLGDALVHVGENLGMENERITHGRAKELCDLATENLSVLIAENPKALSYLPTGIPDSEFIRVMKGDEARTAKRTIPMTKAEVRAAAVGKLKIRKDDVCWDVGCGTGSVSVEMALRCPEGCVYGYDRLMEAAALTLQNAQKFSCDNIHVFCCEFPPQEAPGTSGQPAEVFQMQLPVPDCVFIGGAGGKIHEITALAKRLNPKVRIVAAAVTMETLEEARDALTGAFGTCEIIQMSVSRAERTGRVTMLKALNPVFLLSGGAG